MPRASDCSGFFAERIHYARLHPFTRHTNQVRKDTFIESRNTYRMTRRNKKQGVKQVAVTVLNTPFLQSCEQRNDVIPQSVWSEAHGEQSAKERAFVTGGGGSMHGIEERGDL